MFKKAAALLISAVIMASSSAVAFAESAPVQTGHDHRAGKRERSDAGHMPTPDAVPKSKAHAPDGISGYWE